MFIWPIVWTLRVVTLFLLCFIYADNTKFSTEKQNGLILDNVVVGGYSANESNIDICRELYPKYGQLFPSDFQFMCLLPTGGLYNTRDDLLDIEYIRTEQEDIYSTNKINRGKFSEKMVDSLEIQDSSLTGTYSLTKASHYTVLESSDNISTSFKAYYFGLNEYLLSNKDEFSLYNPQSQLLTPIKIFEQGVLSNHTPLNYLANINNPYIYYITDQGSYSLETWPINHMVFICGYFMNGLFTVTVTGISPTRIYYSVTLNSYLQTITTACSDENGIVLNKIDSSNWILSSGDWIELTIVRRYYGFILFTNGYRRYLLDMQDCWSDPLKVIKVDNGYSAIIIPSIEDCKVTQWSAWTTCSKSCSVGSKVRRRDVIMPQMNNGTACPLLIESRECNEDISCSNCIYGSWSSWSSCSVSCGTGTSKKGANCNKTFEMNTCNTFQCPTNCVLSQWSEWSICSATCGQGVQLSSRITILSQSDGGNCPDNLSRTQSCMIKICTLPCVPNPCLHNGKCTSLPHSKFICSCSEFYQGEICDEFIIPWWIYPIFIIIGFFMAGTIYRLFIANYTVTTAESANYGDEQLDAQPLPQSSNIPPPNYSAQEDPYLFGLDNSEWQY
ncbi:thrombospondin type 1 domain-containing protein [Cryptosporidium muris RN66]|uniref:Thrombospondin type 1 domain-containing protein n=1 Tax=Cryptosporidium muris (strain RN66) TaxID=441375 RepID=B6A9B4_CRYMR|nr:thrombospondin type 1 domain-containing protein [Cryptosporidium muris RN66]EEA04805.1 thrombospondin type 1 domain-containing protein [Cryptosporidium muris RN66]|eukprot:XP_002139154.1 thrombospondin type 1 domain-containing protein [Cryptosporidium muris RN66]